MRASDRETDLSQKNGLCPAKKWTRRGGGKKSSGYDLFDNSHSQWEAQRGTPRSDAESKSIEERE